MKMFYKLYKDVLELVERFINEEMFLKDVYKWVGGSVFGLYFVSVILSYYDWVMKKFKVY